jgi:hypothetical protein
LTLTQSAGFRNSSGSLAMFTAIGRASSRVSGLVALAVESTRSLHYKNFT